MFHDVANSGNLKKKLIQWRDKSQTHAGNSEKKFFSLLKKANKYFRKLLLE